MTKSKKKIGKPTLCTPARIKAIAEIVSRGNYITSACRLIGIGERTGYQWLEKGEDDLESGNVGTVYAQYAQAIKKAEAEAEDKMIAVVRTAAVESKNWLAAMTWLERRHPDRWGRKDRTAITIDHDKRVTITHVEVIKDYGQGGRIVESEARELPAPKEGE